MDAFFEKTFTCTFCHTTFKEFRVKKSKQRISRVDSDFAIHTNGPNPLFYLISVCPTCGYSFTPNFTAHSSRSIKALKSALLPSSENFSRERPLELATLAFQRSIWCATLNEEKQRVIAGLYMHLAWMFRFAEDEKEEKIHLARARRCYIDAYENDRRITNIAQVAYVIGETYRRLGEEEEAVRWFYRVIHEFGSTSPQMANMARKMWQEVRGEREKRKATEQQT